MALKIVIDTNVLVSALSSKSNYHWLLELLLEEKFDLYITDEILFEYEEVLKAKYSDSVATNFLAALKELPSVYFTHVYFRWNLISDADDNKFVDCYVAAGARLDGAAFSKQQLDYKCGVWLRSSIQKGRLNYNIQFLELAPIIDELFAKRKKTSSQWK
jgi:putative PIN family toxin of toxin-antitoxin system